MPIVVAISTIGETQSAYFIRENAPSGLYLDNVDVLKIMGGYMTPYFLMSEFLEKMNIQSVLNKFV